MLFRSNVINEEAARQSQREDLRKKLAIVENPVKAAELNVE